MENPLRKYGPDEFEFAPQDKIDKLGPWVDMVLEAIGHPVAWVSDESMVGDFGLDDGEIADAGIALGFGIKNTDYIYDLAECLRDLKSVNE